MKEYTDITVLLDRSGSMAHIKEAMESAFNGFIKEHKSVPSTRLTLVQFDDINDQDVVYQCVPIRSAEKLHLRPRGNTPLLDAMCKVVDRTGRRLADMNERDRPDQVLMVIITDGKENASRSYMRTDVYDRITKQREDYKWNFIYLGANQDTFAESKSFGIPWVNTIKWTPDDYHVAQVGSSLRGATMAYANNTSGMRGMSTGFSEEERVKTATKDDLDKDSNPKVKVDYNDGHQ